MIGTDMGHTDLNFFNMDTDQRIKVDLSKDPLWPGGGALHTIITPDGSKAYLSVMSSDKDPATFLALSIDKLDWKAGTADVKITKVMRAAEPGEKPRHGRALQQLSHALIPRLIRGLVKGGRNMRFRRKSALPHDL